MKFSNVFKRKTDAQGRHITANRENEHRAPKVVLERLSSYEDSKKADEKTNKAEDDADVLDPQISNRSLLYGAIIGGNVATKIRGGTSYAHQILV